MKFLGYLSLLATVQLIAAPFAEREMPLTLRAASGSNVAPPIWVSSRAAFDADGRLRADMFEPAFRRILETNQQRNSSGCVSALGAPVIENHRQDSSFDDVVAHARTIIAATVLSSDTGFYNGTPGTLFGLRVIDVPKAQGRFSPAEKHPRLFVANATLVTPHGTICSREPYAPALPNVGDRVIVFSTTDPRDAERALLVAEPRAHLVIEHGRDTFAPAVLGRETAKWSFEDVLQRVRVNPHLLDSTDND